MQAVVDRMRRLPSRRLLSGHVSHGYSQAQQPLIMLEPEPPEALHLKARGSEGPVHGDGDRRAAAAVKQNVSGCRPNGRDARVAWPHGHEGADRVLQRHAAAPVHVCQRCCGRASQACWSRHFCSHTVPYQRRCGRASQACRSRHCCSHTVPHQRRCGRASQACGSRHFCSHAAPLSAPLRARVPGLREQAFLFTCGTVSAPLRARVPGMREQATMVAAQAWTASQRRRLMMMRRAHLACRKERS